MKKFALVLALLSIFALAPLATAKAEGIPPCCESYPVTYYYDDNVYYLNNNVYYYPDDYAYIPYLAQPYNTYYYYPNYYAAPLYKTELSYYYPELTVDENCNWTVGKKQVDVSFYTVDNTPIIVYSNEDVNLVSYDYGRNYWAGDGSYYYSGYPYYGGYYYGNPYTIYPYYSYPYYTGYIGYPRSFATGFTPCSK
ncbi:MAG: hypothetical protein Q4P08_00180 [Eubacteriales bacterium]|nr:hypothetical protein [Eubacteriales bacterium]